jgi:hypothetical protein
MFLFLTWTETASTFSDTNTSLHIKVYHFWYRFLSPTGTKELPDMHFLAH